MLLAVSMISRVRLMARVGVLFCRRVSSAQRSLITSNLMCIHPVSLMVAMPGRFGSHPSRALAQVSWTLQEFDQDVCFQGAKDQEVLEGVVCL